jgi:hypothetical protein
MIADEIQRTNAKDEIVDIFLKEIIDSCNILLNRYQSKN